jgi:hypothetical protein
LTKKSLKLQRLEMSNATLFSPLHLPVAVLPIGSISNATFDEYFQTLQTLSVVSLEDVVQPSNLNDPNQSANKFTRQLFHQGTVYIEYVKEYRQDLAYLSDMELYRQVVAVIFGFPSSTILDCCES